MKIAVEESRALLYETCQVVDHEIGYEKILESDKSVFEFECPGDGLVRKILAHDGDTVPVQSVIAIIGDAESAIPEAWST